MTALYYYGCSDGFVMGADGRGRALDGTITDNNQKIFSFDNSIIAGMFGWASKGIHVGQPTAYVDLIDLTRKTLTHGSVSDVANELEKSLRWFRTEYAGPHSNGIFLFYGDTGPTAAEISICSTGFCPGFRIKVENSSGFNGSFGTVSGPLLDGGPNSLMDAEERITKHLQITVQSPTDLIGGDVHVGRFTKDGFSWSIAPKNPN